MTAEDGIQVGILGASGYTGAELVRLLRGHPVFRIAALVGDSQAGQAMGAIYPHLAGMDLPPVTKADALDLSSIQLVFACLPHGVASHTLPAMLKAHPHLRVVDLSADFRLSDAQIYAEWYGEEHPAKECLAEAVYGLTEVKRSAVASARLVANPGCYPTSAQLSLLPLLTHELISPESITIDAKSGISGAGRSVKQGNLFTEVNEGLSAYGVGHHRHMPEIEQGLSEAAGRHIEIGFTPHMVPMNRGILSTIYVGLDVGVTVDDLRACLQKVYAEERFVRVLPEGVPAPSTAHVRGTNDCIIGVYPDRRAGRAIVVSVIDNLVKGASGQALQNANLMFGYPENLGLELGAVFP